MFNHFPRNKVTVILKLILLASHIDKYATALINNLQKTSEYDVMFDKHRRQTLAVALFNLCYAFHLIDFKHIKWCIVPQIIVQMDHSFPPKQDSFERLAAKYEDCAVEAVLDYYTFTSSCIRE